MIFIGIFSGLAIVTKPIAILAIFPIVLSIILTNGISYKMVRYIIVLFIINFSFHFFWEKYKEYNNPTSTFEILDFIEHSINMTAIRGGLVDYGKGTPLYDRIDEKNLLDTARNEGVAATIIDLCDQSANNTGTHQSEIYELQGKDYSINVTSLMGKDNFAKAFYISFVVE